MILWLSLLLFCNTSLTTPPPLLVPWLVCAYCVFVCMCMHVCTVCICTSCWRGMLVVCVCVCVFILIQWSLFSHAGTKSAEEFNVASIELGGHLPIRGSGWSCGIIWGVHGYMWRGLNSRFAGEKGGKILILFWTAKFRGIIQVHLVVWIIPVVRGVSLF